MRDDKVKLQKLNDLIKSACNKSLFYRNKFIKSGFNPASTPIKTKADLVKIPLLTRSDLMHTDVWNRLFMPIETTISVGYTSGFTKQQLLPLWRNYFSAEPPQGIEAKRILITPVQPWRVIGQSEWFQRKKIFVVCGDIHNLALTGELASIMHIDSMYTSPTVALMLMPFLKKKYNPRNIKYLILYGEKLSEVRRQALYDVYPQVEIVTHYALSEIGPAGNSCPSNNNHELYHQDKNFLYEAVDPLTGKSTLPGQEGELVITTLASVPSPMIRYRTGDTAIVSDNPCVCLAKTPFFKIVGRINYDVVKVGGFALKADAFEKGVEKMDHFIYPEKTEVHIYEKGRADTAQNVKPKFVFKVMPKKELSDADKEALLDFIRNHIDVGRDLTIGDAEQKGYILTPEIEIIHSGAGNQAIRKKRILVSHL